MKSSPKDIRLEELNSASLPGAPLLPGEEVDASRRAFLQYAGFGIASAALAGCSRGPVKSVLPNAVATVDIVAGKAYWIATSCQGCAASCGVLAKCRDGRPVKLEGNDLHALSRGGLCASGQSQVLSLYDSKRLNAPEVDGVAVDWEQLDTRLRALLDGTRSSGGRVRLLTGTIHSPSTRGWIERFGSLGGDFRHVEYDALSVSAILDAHATSHGVRALPAYRFAQAEVIASFGADFLGTWISPVSFAADWAAGRRPDDDHPHMSRHVHFEAGMTITGSAADRRTRLAPWEQAGALSALCEALELRSGAEQRVSGALEGHRLRAELETLADELWAARGRSLVVCGANDTSLQLLVNHANALLENYGKTLSVARPSLQRRGSDAQLVALGRELSAGSVDILIVSGANPAYDLPTDLAAAIVGAKTLIVHSDGLDETAALAKYRVPASHALESWGDGEPELGRYSLNQPTVPSLHNGRTLRELLARFVADERDDRDLLEAHWRDAVHPEFKGSGGFEAFFKQALHDGYVERVTSAGEPEYDASAVSTVQKNAPEAGLGLLLYAKVGLLDGAHAHNPWLQELPDPVTKVTWDNYASLSEQRAAELGVELGDVVRLAIEGNEPLELPVVVQRGQHDDVVCVALGYGRLGTDRFAGVGPDWIEGRPTIRAGETIGVNAAPLLRMSAGNLRGDIAGVRLERTGRSAVLAATQDHHTLEIPANLAPQGGEVRDAVMTTSLASYVSDPDHALHHEHVPDADLWPDDHGKPRHHWGMSVDLSACIGCSACAVSCQAENNVPVVGRDEVSRHREMHWMRIDRYLEGKDDEVSAAYQPMFCQQCDNAPCEAVCPVLATVHSSEGLNQQVYNRCVGTRYCANTCPYKARRFNWFDYPREDRLQNQQLNPDVTVRTRGVMEKCTFCAQRIQEAKSEAARRGEPLKDGDIQVACQQSCPTRAIVFGDTNDPESAVSKLAARQRGYGVLTELNVKPSVRYLARVRNVDEQGHAQVEEHHG